MVKNEILKIVEIDPTFIYKNPEDPRKKEYTSEMLETNKKSIENDGQNDEIIVTPKNKEGCYMCVSGWGRVLICKELGTKVRAKIINFSSKKEMRKRAWSSNIHQNIMEAWEREQHIYEMWNNGKGEYKTLDELGKDFSMHIKNIRKYLEAYEKRKEMKENGMDTTTFSTNDIIEFGKYNSNPELQKEVILDVENKKILKSDISSQLKTKSKLKKILSQNEIEKENEKKKNDLEIGWNNELMVNIPNIFNPISLLEFNDIKFNEKFIFMINSCKIKLNQILKDMIENSRFDETTKKMAKEICKK